MYIKLLGEEHLNIATSYNNLGLVNKIKCKYPKALEYYERDLRLHLNYLVKRM